MKIDEMKGLTLGELRRSGKIARESRVRDLTGLSRITRWRMERRGEFPLKVHLSEGAVGWLESEVVEWIQNRVAARSPQTTCTHPSNPRVKG
jgi:prophage regulatory protein